MLAPFDGVQPMTTRAWTGIIFRPRLFLVASVAVASLYVGATQAGEVAERHSEWRGCLHRTFAFQAALTGRAMAADITLKTCRLREEAYLAALASSPLVDGEDVARVRPALLQRARDWLIGGPASRPL